MRSRIATWSVGIVLLVSSAAVAASDPVEISVGARALAVGKRGEQVQTQPLPPPPVVCERVVVIGDSLTDNAGPWLRDGLRDAGFTRRVDAQPSRRIPASVAAPRSGVRAAWAVRASFGEAECWVVALGSNDLIFGAADPLTADALISEMLAAVTPGADVWWVNLDYHRDPRTSFDFEGATAAFNRVLDDRAAADDELHVIDWFSLAEANLQWFFDPVHVDTTGSIARAQQVIDALPGPQP